MFAGKINTWFTLNVLICLLTTKAARLVIFKSPILLDAALSLVNLVHISRSLGPGPSRLSKT
jgi:hypothetical protein